MPLSQAKIETAMASWTALNKALASASEEDAKQLLEIERRGRNAERVLLRIHGRLNKMRAARERLELINWAKLSPEARDKALAKAGAV